MNTRFALAAMLAAAGACWAAPPPLPAVALPASLPRPVIDGRLDDAAWQLAPPYTAFRRFRPDVHLQPAHRSEMRVLIEPGALVVAVRAWDPEPAQIRAPLSRRDQVWPEQDSVTLWIDAAGRGQHAQFVRVNAAGSLSDGLYSAADDQEDASPDFLDVEVAAQRLPDGYSVEIRWPLSNLRYPLDGDRPWGLMLTRRVPRSTPMSFASSPLDREQPHLLTQMQALADEAPLRAQLGDARHGVLRAETTVRHDGERLRANLGLELQWRPRADWLVDATLRPDFSQVELDEPQLAGNTRFALFLQEKRAFFLESSDVVGQAPPDGWGVSRGLLAFYSRAVADPRWGLRATQRGAEQEGTLMLLRDAGGGLLLRPDAFGTSSVAADRASQLLFARQRFRVGEQLAVAPLVSLRDWGEGARTTVAGADFLWTPSSAWQWRGHGLLSEDRTAVDAGGRLDRSAEPARSSALWLSGRWRDGDWRLLWDSERIGSRFVNDNGFVPQNGIARHQLDLLHAFHPGSDWVTVWELLLRATHTQALRDPARGVAQAQTVSDALQPGFWLLGPWASELWGHANLERQRVQAGGRLHQPLSMTLGLDTRPGARLSLVHLELTAGERVDQLADRVGRGEQLGAQISWRQPLGELGRNLELEQRVNSGEIRTPGGLPALREFSSQTKLILHLRQDQAVRLLWQLQRLQREAEPGIASERLRSRTATLTWLARASALRGWSLGASWQRDDGQAARRELFLKFQQGWAQ